MNFSKFAAHPGGQRVICVVLLVDAPEVSGGCERLLTLDCGFSFGRYVAAVWMTGPPCEQEIALVCPDGLIDACLLAPPAAETHICVAK